MEGIQVNGAETTMSLQGKGQANRSRHSANFCTGIRFLTFVLNLSQVKLRFCFLCECLNFSSETQLPMSLHFLVMLSTICGDVHGKNVSQQNVSRQMFTAKCSRQNVNGNGAIHNYLQTRFLKCLGHDK